ncbi:MULTISPECIES: hypothetical protein [Burkholderia]|uniref:hypothetical protein n=1 Tax=Burkholderia TaxID=32008 RepID=UPI001B93B413|nr:hypothetical protein [Burkholderia multivorans]MBR8047123.1 hypothetical protein [Burkholderia multivorans]MCA8225910.1 hypothetical protein [Burkholderia multivorans]
MSALPIPMDRFWRADLWTVPTGEEIRQVIEVSRLSAQETAALLGLADSSFVERWLDDVSPIPYSAWAMLCANAGLGSIWNSGPGPELALEDYFRPRAKKERRVYENFEVTATSDPFACVVEVNLALLSWALKGDSIWAANSSERNRETFRPDRYARVHQEFTSGEVVYMPYLSFDRGRTTITDGRHRLYALIDLGYTHCPIVADSDHVAAIATLMRDEP